MLVAMYVSLAVPLSFLAGGSEWIAWYLGFGALVFGIGVVGRTAGLKDRAVGLIQILSLPVAQIIAFAGDVAWLWVIPNREVVMRFWDLGQTLAQRFLLEIAPLAPSTGLFALIGIAGGLVAWTFDWYGITLRAPAATGMFAALTLVVTIAFVRMGLPVWAMAPTVAAYLGLLAVTAPGARPRFGSVAVLAGALVVGLAASAAPGLGVGALVKGGDSGLIGSIPFSGDDTGTSVQVLSDRQTLVDVGRDLQEQSNFEVLRYATAATEPVYLRLTSLSAFDGTEWLHQDERQATFDVPTNNWFDRALAVDAPAEPRTGLDAVAVEVKALDSPWVPAPYMPLDIWQTVGAVQMDLADRTLYDLEYDGKLKSYAVSWALAGGGASAAQEAGRLGGPPGAGVDGSELLIEEGHPDVEPLSDSVDYLGLPPGLPDVIGQTARTAVAGVAAVPVPVPPSEPVGQSLAYGQAVALVDYFASSGFEYSLDTPAEPEDGGDQGEVIARFLEEKSGYCVHFAAAMTLMARELGIPARIAVGYMPGRQVGSGDPGHSGLYYDGREIRVYSVTADRLHSWPELYIDELGWVGFEPTVGAGASETRSPSPSRSASPSPSASPSASGASPSATTGPGRRGSAAPRTVPVVTWCGIIFGALFAGSAAPGLWRTVLRRRRLGAGLGSVWDEVRDTTTDLGLGVPPWRTPADFSGEIGAVLRAAGQDAAADDLTRLSAAVEAAAYGPPPGVGDAAGSQMRAANHAAPDQAPLEGLDASASRPAPAQAGAWGEAVVRALASSQPRRVRLLAWWFPRSLRRSGGRASRA
jgi:hypothetical protein